MCVRMVLQAAISFRAVPKVIQEVFSNFPVMQTHKIPCFKTVGRWLVRIGLFKLNRLKEKANDWAAIVDFSIQVGTQKCLVVVGLRLSRLKKDKPYTTRAFIFSFTEIFLLSTVPLYGF